MGKQSLDNSFQMIQKARSLSRSDDESWWNPYRRINWGKKNKTWDVNDAENGPTSARKGTSQQNDHGATRADHQHRHVSTAHTAAPVLEPNRPATHLRQRRIEEKDETAHQQSGSASTSPVDAHDHTPLTPAVAAADTSTNHHQRKTNKKKDEGLIKHVQPKTPFTVGNQIQRTILNSWINLLLLAAPVGIALNYVPGVSKIVVFVVNFIAIIPLAAMLSFATEEIALRTGETLGGLLNATFGNAVELIVAIIALVDDKFRIVQTSLIGSILSNLLLVMGFCFFFGGLRRSEQFFNVTVAQTAASLLALAAASVIVPTVFDVASDTPIDAVAKLSRGTSVILLIVYAAYLLFQLKTHSAVFSEESQKVPAKPWRADSLGAGAVSTGLAVPGAVVGTTAGVSSQADNERLAEMLLHARTHTGLHTHNTDDASDDDDEEEEEPQLHFAVAMATLALSTAVIALCAEYMVDSIDAVTQQGGLSEEFVGLILLPIVGNAAEHATAVTVAIKDKMDLAIGVAVGSSMQVALFLIPLLVVIGWGMGKDEMNLSFDIFQVAVMFVAVLLTNYLIGDGKSHWLEGFLLICLYSIIAVCAFWYPEDGSTPGLQ